MARAKNKSVSTLATLLGFMAAATALAEPPAGVKVAIGPTNIPKGNAQGARDITLTNGKLAVAFAVDTAPPWGVPRGGVIDVAEIRDGNVGPDRASLLDFLPDGWSKWINADPRVTIVQEDPAEAAVQAVRDWKGVEIRTTYRLKAGESTLHVVTQMSNKGEEAHPGILSGYALWPDGGYLFGMPGMSGVSEGGTGNALANWSAAYDEDWVLGLHAPFADRMQDEARDRYLLHDLSPGQTRSFEAWLQLEPTGSLAPLVVHEIGIANLASGRISGRVSTADGKPVATPAVVVEKSMQGLPQPYTWALGHDGRYELELPAGRYTLYASARGHSTSKRVTMELRANEELRQDFSDLELPGELSVQVLEKSSRQPLDARLSIEQGAKPLIEYFGKKTFFTQIAPAGRVSLSLAPGAYTFRVATAEGFTAKPGWLNVTVKPGMRQAARAELSVLANPAAQGWYSGDMHHHSDVLDGFTEPDFVMRSQLAAGLDITLLSDHDSVVNNREMKRLAAGRGVPFIPGTEFSPSWAHFNSYPLDMNEEIGIDPGTASAREIFREARRMGADIIQINHPYQTYGYFHTDETGEIPGGYSDEFDLVEITAGDLEANSATIERIWNLWNQGRKAYLSAGSDAHDVWLDVSGAARMYVKVEGELTVERFIAALKRGNAYATTGPLVYPEQMFGEEVLHVRGTPLSLDYSIQAIHGLVSVKLIEQGQQIQSLGFDSTEDLSRVGFVVTPQADTWYSLVVEDANGKYLLSNPVWVKIRDGAGLDAAH